MEQEGTPTSGSRSGARRPSAEDPNPGGIRAWGADRWPEAHLRKALRLRHQGERPRPIRSSWSGGGITIVCAVTDTTDMPRAADRLSGLYPLSVL
ncbi:hypothetical protein GUJ93_ZPchr0010g8462 [Zizania palustris]|uniref:Uncharacterized protein n=1 Tax=Zizania palustris TaxID=103762 RepID=A0A8J6BNT9_ZIZPA|nr:hypothetical protein GUJ93_ZPchr0010g8462 [Zizania palustris]